FRFERGTDPDIPVYALQKAALLIQEVAGGVVESVVTDNYAEPVLPFEFPVSYKRVQRLIGKEIPCEEIKSIIESLGIEVRKGEQDEFQVRVPPYKVDVTREVDI